MSSSIPFFSVWVFRQAEAVGADAAVGRDVIIRDARQSRSRHSFNTRLLGLVRRAACVYGRDPALAL